MNLPKYALPISATAMLALFACSNASKGKKGASGQDTDTVAEARSNGESLQTVSAAGCDKSLWQHVYDPGRLQQLSPCISVVGTVDESSVDADGDQHFLIKLDAADQHLINKRNTKKKGGDLVAEIVCANPTTMKKVKSACAGYTNSIPLPTVGSRVKVTGTYVIDSHNGWAEVHPVSRVENGS
ncbi:MAG: hypothetical protein ABI408_11045 [Gemmatimonadaceae bacterium]